MRPLILLSNDDGYEAFGIRCLAEALGKVGDVVVVAPLNEQSAQSHAISLHRPLRHKRVSDFVHAIDGTPVDCVYVALFRSELLPRRPDICVSGINHGANLGGDVVYSGTVAAAREAAMRGVPAVAFSQVGKASEERLLASASEAADLVRRFLALGPELAAAEQTPLLNINFPAVLSKGQRSTCLGARHYSEGVEVREDPRGREYYWLGGPGGVRHGEVAGSDTEAVDAGYTSISALSLHPAFEAHFSFTQRLAAGV